MFFFSLLPFWIFPLFLIALIILSHWTPFLNSKLHLPRYYCPVGAASNNSLFRVQEHLDVAQPIWAKCIELGNIFSVTYNPGAGTATWTNLDGSGPNAFPDFPATGIAFDSVKNDLYASNDWGVLRLPNFQNWTVAGKDLPNVEVAGLTIVPTARTLYAATHGLSAWQLTLP